MNREIFWLAMTLMCFFVAGFKKDADFFCIGMSCYIVAEMQKNKNEGKP